MKHIFIILFFLGSLSVIAQPHIGMSPWYSIAPAGATSPVFGIAYGSTVSVTCYIKNKGSAAYTGLVTIYKRVDTTANSGTVALYDSIGVSNFLPSDSIQVVITETVTTTNYKQSGNGNTIVVWPYVSGVPANDTLKTGPVYVSGIAGIEELNTDHLSIFPNPASNSLLIKTHEGIIYDRIYIYDAQSRKIMDISFREQVNISALAQGTYWITVSTKSNKRFSTRFIKTE